MKLELEGIYRAAQAELAARNKEEYIHVGLTREIVFGDLTEQIQKIVLITEPEISPESLITVYFGHFNPYEGVPGTINPEAYSFGVSWERSDLPDGVPTAVDGFHFSIEVDGESDELKYGANVKSSMSNMRSNLQRERIFAQMVENDPETAPLMDEYEEILGLISQREVQEELLKELVEIFGK